MEFYALSPAFDGVYMLLHETCSDNNVYGEAVGNDDRQMEHKVAEARLNDRHAEKS